MSSRFEAYDMASGAVCGHKHIKVTLAVRCAYDYEWEAPAIRKVDKNDVIGLSDEDIHDAKLEIQKIEERVEAMITSEMQKKNGRYVE
jgi:hypothetical protein